MLSAFILSMGSYSAMLLAKQLIYRCHVHPGPLVLRTSPFKFPTPTTDRDQTVSRRFEPSSRTTLIGEQPNPYLGAPPLHFGRRPPQSNCPSNTVLQRVNLPVRMIEIQKLYFTVDSTNASALASKSPTYPTYEFQAFNIKLQ